MKTVAHFYGKVNKLNQPPNPSFVTLKDAENGKTCDTDAFTEKLLEAGINKDGDQFEIVITEALDGTVTAKMTKSTAESPVSFDI